MKEGTGRVVRFDLIPLEELKRPRIDILASLSGIFRDSFANVVDLLDDMFERCAKADEPIDMNFIKKHALELEKDGVERPAARLFSNPPGGKYIYLAVDMSHDISDVRAHAHIDMSIFIKQIMAVWYVVVFHFCLDYAIDFLNNIIPLSVE